MGLKEIRTRFGKARGAALVAVLAAVLGTIAVQARAPNATFSGSSTASVVVTGLPPQGQDVMHQIRQGGPFRYDKDGSVFGNRERLLPVLAQTDDRFGPCCRIIRIAPGVAPENGAACVRKLARKCILDFDESVADELFDLRIAERARGICSVRHKTALINIGQQHALR